MGFENGKLVRVALVATHGSRQEVNTLHYDLQDATLEAANDPQSLANRIRDDVIPKFRALYRPDWSIQPVVVTQEKDPQNPLAVRGEWNAGTVLPGTLGGSADLLPSACCVVAKLSSDHIGRRYNGRMFIGGSFNEGDQVGNNWYAGVFVLYGAFLDSIPKTPDIAEGASSSTAKWVVYSRTQRAADADPYASPITSYTIRPAVHWLRRRAGI